MSSNVDERRKRSSYALAYFSGVLKRVNETADSDRNSLDPDTVEEIVEKFNKSLENSDVEGDRLYID